MTSADKSGGLGDDQGTRVGNPDPGPASPSTHSDGPSSRPARKTGTGTEATQATDGEAEGHDREHRSSYGGQGGEPQKPSGARGTREP